MRIAAERATAEVARQQCINKQLEIVNKQNQEKLKVLQDQLTIQK